MNVASTAEPTAPLFGVATLTVNDLADFIPSFSAEF